MAETHLLDEQLQGLLRERVMQLEGLPEDEWYEFQHHVTFKHSEGKWSFILGGLVLKVSPFETHVSRRKRRWWKFWFWQS